MMRKGPVVLFKAAARCKAAINCLAQVSFALKNGAGRQAEAKKFDFFEKKYILLVGYLFIICVCIYLHFSMYEYL